MDRPLDVQDHEFIGVVLDINVHTNQMHVVPIESEKQRLSQWNPPAWYRNVGVWVNRFGDQPHIGDTVQMEFSSSNYRSQWGVAKVLTKTAAPGKPTYERVNEGRWYDKYLCCSKASKSDRFCVCTVVITCPVHGGGCIGSHD